MDNFIVAGIDPGTTSTAVAVWNGSEVLYKAKTENNQLRNWILKELDSYGVKLVVLETMQSYGARVGQSVFETCQWIGHFTEAIGHTEPKQLIKIKRSRIKIHHCGTTKSNDAAVRKALITRLGEPGTKKNPGVTYKVTADMWSGLALAVFGYDTHGPSEENR